MNTHIDVARSLSDDALLDRAQDLAARERGTMAELIAHLAEVEARELYLSRGYGSMFTYCREALRFSEHEAYHRVEVARAVRRFPVLLDRLADGALNLTTARLVARHLTDENHLEVLAAARGRSRSEVEMIVARLDPRPDAPATVRKLPAPKTGPEPGNAEIARVAAGRSAVASSGSAPPENPSMVPPSMAPLFPSPLLPTAPDSATPRTETRPAVVSALSADRYKLQLTIDGETREMLRLAQDLSRHASPSGDESQILKRALVLLVADLAKKKFADTDRPQRSRGGAPDSRHVPAEVKRLVYVRDLGRCAFVGQDGRRCGERAFVEFHHVKPYVEGGLPTVDNIQLRCGRHNRYEWNERSKHVRVQEEEWLGRRLMASKSTRVISMGEGSTRGASTRASSSETSTDSARAESAQGILEVFDAG